MIPFPLSTRSVIRPNYALFSEDNRVPSTIPGWEGSSNHVIISRAMGAAFTQLFFALDVGKSGHVITGNDQWFLYMTSGQARLDGKEFNRGAFAYFPPETEFSLVSEARDTKLLVFIKKWEPYPGRTTPLPALSGREETVPKAPFHGDTNALLQTLLSEEPEWDMAVNIFTFKPGGMLPFVETHVMEHGMYFLEGSGVYRLNDDWYPVKSGDSIWIAPYCPQWFVPAGTPDARYIYYKNVNRMP